ncbi:MAG: hypothetical protein H6Q52_2840 [Deltaproteobacteria bacterium]|nr:hypothetical protein [Deltaproteobacteria bacterium]
MLGTILIVVVVLMLLGALREHCPRGLTADSGATARPAG